MITPNSLRSSLVCLTGCLAALVALPASASVIQIASNADAAQYGYGEFTGTIEFSATAFNEGNLTISLTNTSDPSNGGYITGFLFNINSADSNANASLISTLHPTMLPVPPGESGNPFGDFDAGAAISGSFLGGGSPTTGIGVGATGVFEFLITASDAVSLTAMSFITGPNEHNFVTRFRGFGDGESDTVPGKLVPAPGALCLLLGGLFAGGRRRRH
jgi:hypothetical protein